MDLFARIYAGLAGVAGTFAFYYAGSQPKAAAFVAGLGIFCVLSSLDASRHGDP